MRYIQDLKFEATEGQFRHISQVRKVDTKTHEQVVPPGTGTVVRVRAGNRDIRLAIHGIVVSQSSKPLENSVALAGVARGYIQDRVDEPVCWVVDIADDESSRVEPLSQACAHLGQVGVAGELNLDHRARNVSLADSYSVWCVSIYVTVNLWFMMRWLLQVLIPCGGPHFGSKKLLDFLMVVEVNVIKFLQGRREPSCFLPRL